MQDELGEWSAIETAERIKSREVSAEEVVNAAIERARAWQPRINAIVHEDYERARTAASLPLKGRLAGVPTFVKDMEDLAGLPTRYGSAAVPGAIAKQTAPSVAQFLGTGVIPLGKSTTAEFGLTATTEPVHGSPTRNPRNLEHSSGGSSGGASALVAAGVVPIAHGGDGGGSIRVPAAFCGLIGLKASRGRLTDMRSAKRMLIKLATYGVLTRTVSDTAAFYAALEEQGHSSASGKLPPIGDVRGPGSRKWRIGMYHQNPYGHDPDPRMVTAMTDAAKRLEGMGHRVFEVDPPFPDSLPEDFLANWSFMAWAVSKTLRWNKKCDEDMLETWTRSLANEFSSGTWRKTPGALARLRAFPRYYERCFDSYDVLLSPVTAAPAPRLGDISPGRSYEEKLERIRQLLPYTPVQNASGGPAISVPVAVTDDGLPMAVQLASPLGQERRLLELAYALESG